jgi:ribonuclease HII
MPPRKQPEWAVLPDLAFEQVLWLSGCAWVAGIDEAGRGALAGPVSAAAVVLPADPSISSRLHGVRDSKLMTAAQRTTWARSICGWAVSYGIGFAGPEEIDSIGIVPATRLAAWRALDQLNCVPGHLLLDWLFLPDVDQPQTALVKGDRRSLSIAAASVLAKTARDQLLIELDCEYPGYELARHKGYGTRRHLEVLQRLGPSPIHRRSYQPVLLAELSLKQAEIL